MLLQDSRRAARVDGAGELVTLEDQDRKLWDSEAIHEACTVLDRVMRQRRPGPYQLLAAIGACHAHAAKAEDTDWREITVLYDRLSQLAPTPVVLLNRAVAVAMAAGPAAALISASSTLGGALGLAILSAIASSRTHHLLAAHASHPVALTSGFGHALTACSVFLVAAAAIAARTASTRGQPKSSPEPAVVLDPAARTSQPRRARRAGRQQDWRPQSLRNRAGKADQASLNRSDSCSERSRALAGAVRALTPRRVGNP